MIAVFRRLTTSSDQGLQLLSNNTISLTHEATRLDLILIKQFPLDFKFRELWVVPRSTPSFLLVGIRQDLTANLCDSTFAIHTFWFNIAGEECSFEEVGSVVILGSCRTRILQSPPSAAQYMLGILAVAQSVPEDDIDKKTLSKEKHILENFALRIDLPDPDKIRESGSQSRISLTRMKLTPAVYEKGKEVQLKCFDHFSGKFALLDSSTTTPETIIVDYCQENL